MKTPTELRYLKIVSRIGCLIHKERPARIHKIMKGKGLSKRSQNYLIAPLCLECYELINRDKKAFEEVYGSEIELIATTINEVIKRLK